MTGPKLFDSSLPFAWDLFQMCIEMLFGMVPASILCKSVMQEREN